MRLTPSPLTAADIGQIEDAEKLIAFVGGLDYDVADSPRLDHAALGLDSEDLRQQIRSVRRVGVDPVDGEVVVYLFELRSVTIALTQVIARRFRGRPESALLVLTKDFEALDFVLVDREIVPGTAWAGAPRPRTLTVPRRNPSAVDLRVLKRFTFTEADGAYQWEKLRSAFTLAEWTEQYFNNRALFSDYYLTERLTDVALTPAWAEEVRPIGREAARRLAGAREAYSRQPESAIRAGIYEPLLASLGFEVVEAKSSVSDLDSPDYLLYAPGRREKPIAAALKYWWLFFRPAAFTGFLDELLRQSADYAKGLGERLKERVFTTIFPHFAAGFIADMRSRGEPVILSNPNPVILSEAKNLPARTNTPHPANISPADLEIAFAATMTFLYRLMFLLYAESLELLPVYEARGYGELSLLRLKKALAEAGGPVEDEAPRRLAERYGTGSSELYAELQKLCRAVDGGASALNLPKYNGGLFSDETPAGRFLATHAIPDRQLALGLDRLCRDVDDKTHALALIDYKSLGVRHLGSIYEGLLEFKLRIAAEDLAVVKEKGKEVYVPAAAVGSRKVAAALAKGEAYLENDKRERKATGSYYTPDYIVKYIVLHTVGPVQDRKFEDLRPRLHDAQKRYRQHERTVAARGNDQPAALFWRSGDMQRLADDCLDVRVLDPAMGSGHFLVEAVDFISDRLIQFLNAWSENPVWALLDRTRDDIVADMERQRVSVDAERLTRVALLKRAVLKRCIYGVDLNAMAVELAKVSLWLDAFTVGAPLSFLDHHLKHGNSLIGARVAEVQDALAAKPDQMLSLFAQSKFTGVMLATDLMRQVSYLSDNTVGQLEASGAAFRSAADHLAPYKRVLDVYTSRWFGNHPNVKKAAALDPTVEFLQRHDAEAWLKDPAGTYIPTDHINSPRIAETALRVAEEATVITWSTHRL